MIVVVPIFVFFFVLVLLCVGFGKAVLVSRQKQQIRAMLRRADAEGGKPLPELLRPESAEDPIAKALGELRVVRWLDVLLWQSGLAWNTPKLLAMTAILGSIGIALGYVLPPFSSNPGLMLLPSILAAVLPFLWVFRKRSKRFAAFEEQFAEALNFLSRSMRAGHAFTIGLEMLVVDAPQPLASCFRLMLNDLHLGASIEEATAKLVDSIPLIDVRFFVSAILLQQGSGGNLSEILDSMATIIRERFRLKGQVKAVSAHGRITGLILALMPIIVAGLLFISSPTYLLLLVRDSDGQHMVIAAVIGQLIGFLCIRKIVNIRV